MAVTKKETVEEPKSLNEILSFIQSNFKTEKGRFNSFGKYKYRSAEDILEAIKPYLTKFNVTIRINEEIVSFDTVPIVLSTATISNGTDAIHATALVGVDLAQKGMQTPQAFGSASSYGKKYSLGNLLLIDDTQDSDATNSHGKGSSEHKPKLDGAALEKAKEYIKGGGNIDAITAKYEVSPVVLNQLR